MWALSAGDWVIAVATFCGPIFAVQAQKWVELWRRKSDSRVSVFYTLMETRSTRLAYEHVKSLNRIDLEFGSAQFWFFQKEKIKLDKDLLEAWRLYVQHLDISVNQDLEAARIAWNVKSADLFFDLLHKMSLAVGYKFEKSHLQKSSYYPNGHSWREDLNEKVLDGAAKIFSGDASLKMTITNFPTNNNGETV